MKIFARKSCAVRKRSSRGFTLLEIMITSGIFVIIVGAMVSVQIFGLRVYTLAATKITATTSGRETLNDIRDRIRSAKIVYVGIYSNSASGFQTIPIGSPQIGNAIQIFPATNTPVANATVVYMDWAHTNMSMVSNGIVSVEANYMTNYYCFDAEDYNANIFTNYVNNPVIKVIMQFSQWEYPIGYVGNSGAANAYDFYQVRTRITRRASD